MGGGLSESFKEKIKEYLKSHNMSEDDIFKILNKHNEELEREKVHELENKIELAVSTLSEKELINMLKKAAKNSKELRIIKPQKDFTHEKKEKRPIKIIFWNDAQNGVRVSFECGEYIDKGVSTIILASFRYWIEVSRNLEDYLMKADPKSHLLKKMDSKTKMELLTKLYNLIENTKNS